MNVSRLVARAFLSFLLIAFLASPVAAQSPQASERLAVAGLFPDYGVIASPMALPAGGTKIGQLNSRGEGAFALHNPGRGPIASLLVALDTGGSRALAGPERGPLIALAAGLRLSRRTRVRLETDTAGIQRERP